MLVVWFSGAATAVAAGQKAPRRLQSGLSLGRCHVPAGYKAAFASQDVLVMQRFATDRGYLRACSRSSGRDSLVFTIPLYHGLAANEPGYRALGSWLVIATYEGAGPTLSQDTGIIESFNVRTGERGYYVAVRSSALTAVDGPVPQLSPSFAAPFAMTNTGYFAWVEDGIPPGQSVPMSVLYAPSGANGDREADIAPGDGVSDGITDLHSAGATIAYRKNGHPRTLRPGVALKAHPRGAHRAAPSWPRCEAGALRLELNANVSPKTEQTSLLLRLVNQGSRVCTLDGYPRIRLDGPSGSAYPIVYRDSGDQEVTSRRPSTVTLRAGSTAWVLINKNACVTGDHGQVATKLQLAPPGSSVFLNIALPGDGPRFDYCTAPDPGYHVEVSPVEPTAART